MSQRIERLNAILNKISTRAAALKAEGKSTTSLEASIDAAQEAVDAAKLSVDAQAAKDYVVSVTTEDALKTNASTTVKQFMSDIKAVHKEVVDAQIEVKKIFSDLAKLAGEEPKVTPTVAATP